jgi:8-oxo-dGTP pyrophosphatase MutT (NUDIX family)
MAAKTTGKTIDKLALIYIRDRKVLFARTKGQELYYIPGGKRELGENDVQALTREIKEELGSNITTGSLKFMNIFEAPAHNKPPGTMVKLSCYTGSLENEPKPTSEIDDIRFMSSADESRVPYAGILILKWLKKEGLID